MKTQTRSNRSANGAAPPEILPIEKDGFDVASLGKVRSQWTDVTPEMAARWLRNNVRNRSVSDDTVAAYARDMINGKWVPTHQGLAFNDRDELIDGQHRLRAIVASGQTIRMMVTFGLSSMVASAPGVGDLQLTTMDCVDRGRTRSVADQLKIQHGMKNGSMTSMICAAIASLCFKDRTRRLSVGQTLDVYRCFEKPIDWVVAHRSKQPGLRAQGVVAGFAFALAAEEARSGDRFWEGKMAVVRLFECVMSGQGLTNGTPMFLLRKFLTSDEAKLFTPALNRGLAELVLQAIYLELHGRKVKQLEMGEDGADYFRNLQPTAVSAVSALFKLPAAAKAERPAKVAPKLGLDKIMSAVEDRFDVTRSKMATAADDVAFPRAAFVSLALSFGFSRNDIGSMIKRSGAEVLQVHIPKAHLGPNQVKAIDELRARLQ